MRPAVLNTGYPLRAKALFAMIKTATRHPLPDAAKINFYRPDFYGDPMKRLTHQAMRGDSAWTVGERELMAAYVSVANRSAFCVGAHTATAQGSYSNRALVDQVLAAPDDPPVAEPLRSTLLLLGKVTRDSSVTEQDVRRVLDAGATTEQIEQALAVCFAFNVINRLADAFAFEQLSPDGYARGAAFLLRRGYG